MLAIDADGTFFGNEEERLLVDLDGQKAVFEFVPEGVDSIGRKNGVGGCEAAIVVVAEDD